MKLKGYVIEKFNNMMGAYTCNRLVEEAMRQDIDLRIVGVHDTIIQDGGVFNVSGEISIPLEKVDFVINRYKWGRLKNEINSLAKRTYNNLDAFNIFINKYAQLEILSSEAFLKPKYIYGTGLYSYDELTNRLGSPFVAKGLENSMGNEVFLIENREDYLNNISQEKTSYKKESPKKELQKKRISYKIISEY